ncbi:MAG: hypothetical protein LC774_14775 [Acidobacteria bacterium]|nr:hypothetical protein [Acidobacteriota bacterium]
MQRLPRFRRGAVFALFALLLSSLLLTNFFSAGAQVVLSEPQILPGDLGSLAAAGVQERPQLSTGADSYLAVWVDSRTALSGTLFTKRPRDPYSHTYDLVAARVSPAGALLDQAPIMIRADVSIDSAPRAVIEDGAGNWVVAFESFLPQEGTSIPRGTLVARVSNDGTVLDPGGRLVYNHHSQYMGDSDIARAGDRYLLTFIDIGQTYRVMGLLLDANLNQLRNGPEQLLSGTKPRVASNGESWYVVSTGNGTRVSRDGDPVDLGGINIYPVSASDPSLCWDGQYWFVAFNTRYDAATRTYLNDDDIYVSRVSAAGAVIDPAGRPVKQGGGNQISATVAPGLGGGAQVAWQEQHEQINPRVGWNGQNWLVSWLTKRPRDPYSHTYDLVAARVSPAGALLDQAPIRRPRRVVRPSARSCPPPAQSPARRS